jgi:hypothetical protein
VAGRRQVSPSTVVCMATDAADPRDPAGLRHLLDRQSGVVSRRQLRELGARDWHVRGLLRRRELTVVVPGVYVDHTGPLTAQQRRWAAVLACWPAALTGRSVLTDDVDPVHVAVAHGRTLRAIRGVVVHRTSDLDTRVRWNVSPPRMRVEEAALDVAQEQVDLLARFETLASVCRQRRTRPERLVDALRGRRRYRDRPVLLEMLADLQVGACSVLEREYLRLERRHGLPVGDRQRPAVVTRGRVYRDVDYVAQAMVVELVGRAFHDDAAAWEDDHERDLDTTVDDAALTIRLTYGQVLRHGCRTIAKVAALLRRRGWDGTFVTCPTCPGD